VRNVWFAYLSRVPSLAGTKVKWTVHELDLIKGDDRIDFVSERK